MGETNNVEWQAAAAAVIAAGCAVGLAWKFVRPWLRSDGPTGIAEGEDAKAPGESSGLIQIEPLSRN